MTPTLTKNGQERTGLRRRIEEFFLANPDEELSKSDMVAKFDCNMRTLEIHLSNMRDEGLLESVHVYRRPGAAR